MRFECDQKSVIEHPIKVNAVTYGRGEGFKRDNFPGGPGPTTGVCVSNGKYSVMHIFKVSFSGPVMALGGPEYGNGLV